MWFIDESGQYQEINGKLVNVTRGKDPQELGLKYHKNLELLFQYLEKYSNTLSDSDVAHVVNKLNIDHLSSLNEDDLKRLADSLYDQIQETKDIDRDDCW
jgi:hypothetical protein